jgi:putative ABC transport system substrate-binding protein
MMKRREFITLLSGATAWPLAARAQQAGKLPTIGVLGPPTASVWAPWIASFEQRLRELGWTAGRTIAIEYHWAEGRRERFVEIAAEFVQRKVDIIVTAGGAVPAVKQATTVIPIVFALANDPLGGGLVASLSRPGGNVTGLSIQQPELAGKRIGLLREILPNVNRLAIMANGGNPETILEMAEVEAAAHKLGLKVTKLEIRRTADIAPAFEAVSGQADALYVAFDGLIAANRLRLMTFVLSARLPAIVNIREHAEAGALMSYGPNFQDLFRRTAEIVDRVLRGTKPADIPVEQPTKFDLTINLTTAKALGLDVPPTLLARADEVIE